MKQLDDPYRGVATPGGVPDPGEGIDPRWNPTYRFASPASARAENSHALSVYMTVDDYPTTPEARRALVRAYGPYLVQEWLHRRLPLGELFHLVHRPGELGPSDAQRIHRADQGDALAREFGGVPVVIVLANTALRPDLVVSRVRFD
ncbi:MAG: hypothetical protein M3165_07910 [Actinomycetota bacterium]|nr:hypothetical protein [Actinomycetota bacterium]